VERGVLEGRGGPEADAGRPAPERGRTM